MEEVKCGSCYGAETPEQKCCNTCDEVKQVRWDINYVSLKVIIINIDIELGIFEKNMEV